MTLAGLESALTSPAPEALEQDLAQTLIATATVVGTARAVDSATRSVSDQRLGSAVPFVPSAQLAPALRQAVTDQEL